MRELDLNFKRAVKYEYRGTSRQAANSPISFPHGSGVVCVQRPLLARESFVRGTASRAGDRA